MERHDKRHSKHHKEKHKKRVHKKSRSHSGTHDSHDQSYATVNSSKPLVEYSDVSSEALSAPEAGEIDSEASSLGRHVADDLTRRSRSIRTFVDNKTISVTTAAAAPDRERSRRDDYLTRDSLSAARRRHPHPHPLDYVAPEDYDEPRYKKRKEKKKKDKKKKKKKKQRSRSASLESVSPDEMPEASAERPARYAAVPVSEWEKPSSPLRNGSCEPVSPSTPPLLRHAPVAGLAPPPHRDLVESHRTAALHRDIVTVYSPPAHALRERTPIRLLLFTYSIHLRV